MQIAYEYFMMENKDVGASKQGNRKLYHEDCTTGKETGDGRVQQF